MKDSLPQRTISSEPPILEQVPQYNNTICAQPWVGLQVRPDQGLRPCCMFSHNIAQLRNNEDLEKYYNHPELLKIRKQMLSGEWPKGCSECKKEEQTTGTSPRLFSPGFAVSIKEHEETIRINKLEIFTSNVCNMDCVMCNPEFSTKWNSMVDKLSATQINFHLIDKYLPQRLDETTIDSLFIHAKDAQEVLLLGGEPLINKEVHRFIERWSEEQCEGQLTLITNASLLDEKILSTLAQCKNVYLSLSIDAVGATYEWIRGLSWDTIEKKILLAQKYIPKLMLSPTLAAYNIDAFEELYIFAKNNNLRLKSDHILDQPEFLSFRILKKDYCMRIADRIEAFGEGNHTVLVNSLRNTAPFETEKNSLRFIKWCTFFNQQRGINLFDSFFDKNNLR